MTDAVPVWSNTDGNVWSYSYNDLQKYTDEGVLIKYSVVEEKLPDYSQTGKDGNNFVNTVKDDERTRTSVEGTKTWEDYSNAEKTRPTAKEFNLILLADGRPLTKRLSGAIRTGIYGITVMIICRYIHPMDRRSNIR